MALIRVQAGQVRVPLEAPDPAPLVRRLQVVAHQAHRRRRRRSQVAVRRLRRAVHLARHRRRQDRLAVVVHQVNKRHGLFTSYSKDPDLPSQMYWYWTE